MAFNINVFKSNLKFGGARPSLFEVTLTFPSVVIGTAADNTTDGVPGTDNNSTATTALTFMCKASSIPSSTVAPIEVPYFGRKVKFAGNRSFPEWTITVVNDEGFVIRSAFEQWLAGINTHASNLTKFSSDTASGLLQSSYQSSGAVKQYRKNGDLDRTYEFKNVFPSELSPIELSWASENEIEEFTVTLQYDYWISTQPTSIQAQTGGGNITGNGNT